jgi:cytochrome c biogenesis factor
MESTINAIFTVLGFVLVGSAMGPIYRAVKTETVLKVHQGLHSHLEGFTRKLTDVDSEKKPSRIKVAHRSELRRKTDAMVELGL